MSIKNPSLPDAIALIESLVAQNLCDFAREIRLAGLSDGLTPERIDDANEVAIEYADAELPATIRRVVEVYKEMERQTHG